MQLRPWPTNSFNIGAQRTRLRTMRSSLCTAPRPSSSDEKRRFVTDATRAAEGLLTDETLQEIYEITPVNWANTAKNTALMHAIRDERTRRVRNGVAAQEAACKYFIKAPKILDEIMTNEHSNARHKIEAVTGN